MANGTMPFFPDVCLKDMKLMECLWQTLKEKIQAIH